MFNVCSFFRKVEDEGDLCVEEDEDELGDNDGGPNHEDGGPTDDAISNTDKDEKVGRKTRVLNLCGIS